MCVCVWVYVCVCVCVCLNVGFVLYGSNSSMKNFLLYGIMDNFCWVYWHYFKVSISAFAKAFWKIASSQGIFSWTPLKPQHSNPNSNPNPLANQLWCIDFLTPPTPLIIPHRLPVFLESLMPLKNWCSIHAKWSKSILKHSIRFCGIFSKLKTEFYCISFF